MHGINGTHKQRPLVIVSISSNMATTMKEAVSMYQKLNKEWNKKPPNLDKCGDILGQLKVRRSHVFYF